MSFAPDPLVIVSGPTASGKSSLAVSLALEMGGEIISMDSAQLYRGFDIGTDKVSESARQNVPHHCLDIAEPGDSCNVFLWLQHAAEAQRAIIGRSRLPIFAGGTTLYVSAMISGLDPLPPSNQQLRKKLDALSDMELFAKAQALGTGTHLNPNDRVRMSRAIEVALAQQAGEPGIAWPARTDALVIVLLDERQSLYHRIDRRVDEMLDGGLIEEATKLLHSYGPACPAFRTVGYAQCIEYLDGRIDRDILRNSIAQASRRYAKRQLTFWRNEPAKRNWQAVPAGGATSTGSIPARSLSILQLKQAVSERLLKGFDRPEVWYINRETL